MLIVLTQTHWDFLKKTALPTAAAEATLPTAAAGITTGKIAAAGTTAGASSELIRVPVKAVRRAMTAFNSSCFLTISASREANTHGNYLAHE